MSARRVSIVLLCEDNQHEAFVRRFLKKMGSKNSRELRVQKSPTASGSAEQFVREMFPEELKAYRHRSTQAASALVAVVDADVKTCSERIDEFRTECNNLGMPFRYGNEAVAIVIPKRNIETWIHYLNGERVNEDDEYPKLAREGDCQPAVDHLVQLCRTRGLPSDAPNSLSLACDEYDHRIKPFLS
jgi:hypothetical protein